MIRLIDIQQEYDNGTKALKGVSMRIDDGEFVFLVGPSGSGKSTILKLITAEVPPSGGRIMVNGYNLNTIRPSQVAYMRRTLGVIFQDFRLIEKKSIRENLTFAMKAVGASPRAIRERIPYVLKLVGLERKGDRRPDELSGGEQQRVILARALTQDTECLILDEPTNHLDIKYQLQLMNIVKALNLTVVAAIHDLNIAAMYCDRIFALKKGKLVAEGTPAEVLTPEQIYAIYDVHAKRVEDPDTGCISIIYRSEWEKSES